MEAREQEAGAGGGTDRQSSSELSEQLIYACKDGDLNKVKYLVEVEHIDPHSCRDEQYHDTPPHWASSENAWHCGASMSGKSDMVIFVVMHY